MPSPAVSFDAHHVAAGVAVTSSVEVPSGSLQAKQRPLIFATWLAGGKGVTSIGVDRCWLESIKLAHPNAVLVVMTGEEDVITNDDGVDMVFRISYDKGKMGRNPYANFYQYIAQIALLSKLHTMGTHADVVFLDMDVVCFDDISDMFVHQDGIPLHYDYGVCITDDASMPINIGVMTVPAGRYMAACQFLEEVLSLYDLTHWTFTAGQIAIAQFLQLWQQPAATYQLCKDAMHAGHVIRPIEGQLQPMYEVGFFSAVRYNYCKTVTVLHYQGAPAGVKDNAGNVVDQTAPPVPSLDLAAVRPKMVHFVGARKPAMACVFQGLLEGGLSGGYDILNALPDLEEEYAGIAAKLGKTAFDPYSESVVVWGADVDGIQDGMTRQDGSSVSSMTSESDLAGMIDSE